MSCFLCVNFFLNYQPSSHNTILLKGNQRHLQLLLEYSMYLLCTLIHLNIRLTLIFI